MVAWRFHRRSGMTLIELLVVVAILGLLSVMVLPAISGNEESRLTRMAAEQVSGLINQARNDAMGSAQPAGVTLRPATSGTAAAAVLDLFRCRVPPAYRGDVSPAKVQFSLASKLVTHSGATNCLASITTAGVQQHDVIQFDDRGPTYAIGSTPTAAGFTIALRDTDAGQSASNTPWPPENVAMTFAIDRQPRVVGSPVSLGESRCIDLAWSGFTGPSGFEAFGPGGTVAITFDSRGQVSQVMKNGETKTVLGPVFLLVGRVDRVGGSSAARVESDDSTGTNWQYPTSYWIAIDRGSAQVRTAECVPGALTDDASRAWVK